MTKNRALLSVRLDPALAGALERHCAHTGETRSRVVQQSVAQYLVAHSGPTLGSLAETLLPPLPRRAASARRAPRQKRFRDYVREKRRR
jgi:Ribbon-helix-helix protein, copG family